MSRSRPVAALATLLLTGLLLLAGATAASAHASLSATSPADGATVDTVETVELEFNEPVSVPPGGVRVFDQDAERVDDGAPRSLDPQRVAVDVRDDLPDGAYIVTWRVVSADGHPIRGAFVFSVGTGSDVDDDLVARLFAGDDGTAVAALASLTRGAGYAGTLLAGGALAYLLGVARDERERRRGRTWAVRGASLGAVAAVLTLPLQAMAVTGFGPAQALAPDVMGPVLTSPTGVAAVVRLVALAAVVLLVRRVAGAASAVAVGVAVLSFVLDGHTRTVDPTWLLVPTDVVHLVAAAVWFGGLVVLVGALRERRLDDDPVAAAGLVARYSGLATWSVVAVTLAGMAMSWALVRHPRALVSTAYGWTLATKLALAVAVIALGVLNNRRLVPSVARAARAVPAGGAGDEVATSPAPAAVPAGARAGWDQLRRTTRVEVALMVAILAVTGFLVNIRPAAQAAGITGVFETTAPVTDELTLNLVVDPNRAGRNAIHLYLLDATGRPSDAVEDVMLRLSQPARDIGPIERETFVAGPGHWQLDGNELSIPGEWVIEVVVRVDRFTEEVVPVPVVVNPS